MSGASRRGFLAAAGGAGAAALTAGAAGAARGPVVSISDAAGAAGGTEVPLLATYVAGAGRHCRRGIFERLAPGDALALHREPENDYDARAVAVWTERGDKLGYVPRIHNQAVANLMDAGVAPVARVGAVSPGGARPALTLDVRLALVR